MSTPKHMRRDVPIEDAPRRAPEGVSDDSPALSHDACSPVMAEEKSAQVGRSAALMSGLVIVSRLTGFFRTWGQAYAIGVTVMASCYSVANNLPNSLYELVVAGMLTTAFLPVYMSVKKRADAPAPTSTPPTSSPSSSGHGRDRGPGFIFAAPVWTQSFSASSDFDFDLTVWFFRFFVIEVVLYALSTIISGVLNAERDYLWSSAAPIFQQLRDDGVVLRLRLPRCADQPPARARDPRPGQPGRRGDSGARAASLPEETRRSPALAHQLP